MLNEKTLHLDSSDRSVNNESSSLSPTTSRLNGDRHHRSTSTLENVPGDSGDSPGSSNETKTSDDGGQIDRMSPIIDATEVKKNCFYLYKYDAQQNVTCFYIRI